MNEAWAEIGVDRERALVFSPRFGRLYLLSADDVGDAGFQRFIGLRAAARANDLSDPASRIVHDRAGLSGQPLPPVRFDLKVAYAAMRASRRLVPLRASARCVRWIVSRTGARGVARGASASEIGRMVRAIESGVESGDCFARSLITAWLCLSAGRRCTLAVGVLSPTRMMHAWCSVDGDLPYEPSPEHYLYQPLWTLELVP